MNVAYPFILDVEGYPTQIINFFVVIVRLPTLLYIVFHLWPLLRRVCFGCVGRGQISPDHSRVRGFCAGSN